MSFGTYSRKQWLSPYREAPLSLHIIVCCQVLRSTNIYVKSNFIRGSFVKSSKYLDSQFWSCG